MKHAVQVTILDQQYTVRSESSPEEVRRVAAFVNEKVSEVKAANKAVDTLNTAVLALLNVSADYLSLRGRKAEQDGMENRLRHLAERLEQSLPTAPEDALGEEGGFHRWGGAPSVE